MATKTSPRTRQTAPERREALVEAAVEHFAQTGLHGTAVSAITDQVGITQPYAFSLFGTKKGLFLAAVERGCDRIEADLPHGGRRAPARRGRWRRWARPTASSCPIARCCSCSCRATRRAATTRCARSSAGATRSLYELVRELSGADPLELQGFFATGMLINVAAAMDLPELFFDETWMKDCLGPGRRRTATRVRRHARLTEPSSSPAHRPASAARPPCGWRAPASTSSPACAARRTAPRCAREDGRIEPVLVDVTDAGQVAGLAARVGGAPLAGLVNNAGIAVAGPLEGIPLDDVRRQYEVNVFGLLAVTQALLQSIRAGHGRIVNIGSIGGRINTPFVGPYSSSKAAVRSLSAALRRELRPWDIRVALVEPGALDTPIWRKGEEGASETIDALPERVRTLYARPLEALVAATRKIAAGASSPDDAAQAVEHALTAERPKAIYTVGRRARDPGRAAQRPAGAGVRRARGAGDEDRVAAARGLRSPRRVCGAARQRIEGERRPVRRVRPDAIHVMHKTATRRAPDTPSQARSVLRRVHRRCGTANRRSGTRPTPPLPSMRP